MYRILIIAASFVIAVGGLVFLQGGRSDPKMAALAPVEKPIEELTEVTDVSAPLPVATAPVTLSQDMPAADQEVAVAPDVMANLTSSVLADLGVSTTITAPDPAADAAQEMRALTSNILAGLGTAVAPDAQPQDLQGLVTQALQHGQSDAYIAQLLNEASANGQIAVPAALRTSDGGVDTSILLSELVRVARGDDATPAPSDVIAGGAGVEVRVVQQAGETIQYHFYTVQRGDSLGAIAHKFYGDASLFGHIFEANRRILATPDRISSGQRLTIPKLPSEA